MPGCARQPVLSRLRSFATENGDNSKFFCNSRIITFQILGTLVVLEPLCLNSTETCFFRHAGQSGCYCHLLSMGVHICVQTRSRKGTLDFFLNCMKTAHLPSLYFTASLKKNVLLCNEEKTSRGVGLRGGEAVSCEFDISPLSSTCGEGHRNIWPCIVSSFVFSRASLEFTADLLVM